MRAELLPVEAGEPLQPRKAQALCKQPLPREVQPLVQGFLAVLGIPEDGVPQIGKVRADLVRLARVQGDVK